jgi:hypothetical protein
LRAARTLIRVCRPFQDTGWYVEFPAMRKCDCRRLVLPICIAATSAVSWMETIASESNGCLMHFTNRISCFKLPGFGFRRKSVVLTIWAARHAWPDVLTMFRSGTDCYYAGLSSTRTLLSYCNDVWVCYLLVYTDTFSVRSPELETLMHSCLHNHVVDLEHCTPPARPSA